MTRPIKVLVYLILIPPAAIAAFWILVVLGVTTYACGNAALAVRAQDGKARAKAAVQPKADVDLIRESLLASLRDRVLQDRGWRPGRRAEKNNRPTARSPVLPPTRPLQTKARQSTLVYCAGRCTEARQ